MYSFINKSLWEGEILPFSLSHIREIIIIIIILCVYILYWAGVKLVFRPGRGQYGKGV